MNKRCFNSNGRYQVTLTSDNLSRVLYEWLTTGDSKEEALALYRSSEVPASLRKKHDAVSFLYALLEPSTSSP